MNGDEVHCPECDAEPGAPCREFNQWTPYQPWHEVDTHWVRLVAATLVGLDARFAAMEERIVALEKRRPPVPGEDDAE